LHIFKFVGFKDQPKLRLVCSRFKADLDYHIGVSVILRESTLPYTPKLGIRHALIYGLRSVNLLSTILIRPLLLKKITLLGDISHDAFAYIVNTCTNLSNITIPFNRLLLKSKPKLFPVNGEMDAKGILKNLNIVHFIGEPKKEQDIAYACETLSGLLTKTIPNHPLMEIYVDFTLKTNSALMRSCLLTLSLYLFKNSQRLREFHLRIKENDAVLKVCENSVLNFVHDTEMKLYNPYDDVDINSEFGSDILGISSDDANQNDERPDTTKKGKLSSEGEQLVISPYHWKKLPRLRKVNVALTTGIFKHFEGMLWKGVYMEELYLSVSIYNSWPVYCTILSSAVHTLTIIKLMNVNHADLRDGSSLDLECDVFNNCKALRVLWMIGKKQDIFATPKLTGISALPKTLTEVEFGWAVISPWQFFRLLVCFPHMRDISLYYANRTLPSFLKCLKILRWTVALGMTRFKTISIVETKLRFQGGYTEREALTHALKSKAECSYFDKGDTRLIVVSKTKNKKVKNYNL